MTDPDYDYGRDRMASGNDDWKSTSLRDVIQESLFEAAYGPSKTGDCSGWLTTLAVKMTPAVMAWHEQQMRDARTNIAAAMAENDWQAASDAYDILSGKLEALAAPAPSRDISAWAHAIAAERDAILKRVLAKSVHGSVSVADVRDALAPAPSRQEQDESD